MGMDPHVPQDGHIEPHDYPESRAPFVKLLLSTAVQVAAALFVLRWLAPDLWQGEWKNPWGIAMWTVLLGVPMSLFEYIYHRYLLHSALLPFLGSMHDAHRTHHGLTSVKAPVTQKEPEKMVPVHSEYAVEEEHQEESMTFPLYAISIFIPLFLVLFALPLKLIFPGQPIVVGCIFNTTLAYLGYELWHQVLHLPFERYWAPLFNRPGVGPIVRRTYGFHLMHHWRPTANLAVVGLWGFAVWDHIFGTYALPERLPLHRAKVNYYDAELRKPRWPISMIDKVQGPIYRGSRSIENWLARLVGLRRD
ncbi:MAG: hypothetical protein HONBIEJF_00899 [Fimbriimonadaceae bacterium]|nr:hypothetical protein [Fimbriimonadaceae bacterium]